jgi:hypothetical protein
LNRSDIVEFTGVNMSGVVNAQNAWDGCTNMVKFGVTDLSNSNNLSYAWYNTSSLTEFPSGANLGTSASNVAFRFSWQLSGLTAFPALDLSKGNDFTSAWHSCSALTSFPAGAKLGTSASNVNFSSAWRSSGLTSFPALDLSNGSGFANAFQESAITNIKDGVLFGTASTTVNFTNAFNRCSSLVTLPVVFDLSKGNDFQAAWFNCSALVDFPANSFNSLTSVTDFCFVNTWVGCTALSATSVFNILSSIDTSGQSAPSTGPQIDIDYNTATGSLSAATNAAVSALKGRGWSIIVNNVTL